MTCCRSSYLKLQLVWGGGLACGGLATLSWLGVNGFLEWCLISLGLLVLWWCCQGENGYYEGCNRIVEIQKWLGLSCMWSTAHLCWNWLTQKHFVIKLYWYLRETPISANSALIFEGLGVPHDLETDRTVGVPTPEECLNCLQLLCQMLDQITKSLQR